MMRRRPASRRSNSVSENVSRTFSPLLRTFRRSSLATLLTASVSMVVMGLYLSLVLNWVGKVCGVPRRRGLRTAARRRGSFLSEGLPGGLGGEQDSDQGDDGGRHQVPPRGHL